MLDNKKGRCGRIYRMTYHLYKLSEPAKERLYFVYKYSDKAKGNDNLQNQWGGYFWEKQEITRD